MLVNGKRKWPEELRRRYEELVTTSVTTPKANTSLSKASEDDFVPELVVPRKGLEPSLSYREADFKSAASAIPPPGQFRRAIRLERSLLQCLIRSRSIALAPILTLWPWPLECFRHLSAVNFPRSQLPFLTYLTCVLP